jgi:hypothetical protein
MIPCSRILIFFVVVLFYLLSILGSCQARKLVGDFSHLFARKADEKKKAAAEAAEAEFKRRLLAAEEARFANAKAWEAGILV